MKMCSLFDGSGGFPLAGVLCGIEPVMASEVEPYPIAVTRSRFPSMYHIGDVSKVNGAEIEPVDLITFGSPCQDLSVAGKRAGLKHEENGDEETTRSGLFMEAIRIIKEMREATDGKYPTFALWENVPGAFSSNKGEDFRTVLEEFIKIKEPAAKVPEVSKNGWPYADIYVGDGWSVAYRTFDAQFWGVPQRRRRIYLVADFRGERAGKILFEREGLRGYPPKSREERQRASSDAENGPGTADPEAESHLTPETPQNDNHSPTDGHILIDSIGGQSERAWETEKSPTLKATHYKSPPCVMQEQTIDVEMEVAVRKHEVDTEKLVSVLREHRGTMTNKEIADAMGLPETHVSHWFRTDKYFSIPDPEAWYPLKKLLKIETDEFDKPITEFEFKGGSYDMSNRIYVGDVAPTLTTGCDKQLHLLPNKHTECITFEPGVASRCGGHVYEDISGTLRATPGDNQMTLAYSIENHPADSRVDIDESGKVQCLTSRMGTGGGNVPMVLEPVCFQQNQREEVRAMDNVGALTAGAGMHNQNFIAEPIAVESHPQDSRVRISEDRINQTLSSNMGHDASNGGLVMEPVVFDGANITSPANGANPKPGDPCHTLSTDSRNILVEPKQEVINLNKGDVQSKAVLDPSGIAPSLYAGECRGGGGECYVLDKKDNIVGSDLYNLKTTGDKAVALTTNANATGTGPTVICLQGNGIDRADTARCNGKGWKEDQCYTLNTIDRPAVSYPESEENVLCMNVGFFNTIENVSPSLLARDYKDPSLVCYWNGDQVAGTLTANNAGEAQRMPDKENFNCVIQEKAETQYIVRRLTPTECCRLQGFPDGWGEIDPKEDFTDDEYKFWYEVRNTHAAINGKKQQAYTKPQMLTWYNKLHTDSAEYKMWGNGISLPTALYVMQGIADALEEQEREEK